MLARIENIFFNIKNLTLIKLKIVKRKKTEKINQIEDEFFLDFNFDNLSANSV